MKMNHGNIIGAVIAILCGLFILHHSFNYIGFRKYNKYSVWGDDKE